MNDHAAPARSARQAPRWYRRLPQFSLRSLLIAVTLSAVACWWFLRPEAQLEELAGKRLVRRQEVKTFEIPRDPIELGAAASPAGPEFATLFDGQGQVFDEFGGTISTGAYVRNHHEGEWTLYHANGQKAAQGDMLHDARHGLWRVWDPCGNLLSEVTYDATLPSGPNMKPELPFVTSPIPVVGAAAVDRSVLWQFGGAGGVAGPPAMAARAADWDYTPTLQASMRHGPCRSWHPADCPASPRAASEPPLACIGQYANDQRSGLWTWYDRSGRVERRGDFVADQRHGPWEMRNSAGKLVKTTYILGRSQAEHDRHVAAIKADLAGGSMGRAVSAIARAEKLGRYGWPILAAALEGTRPEIQVLALRAFIRQQAFPRACTPLVEPLADHADRRVSRRAKTAIYIAHPERRAELLSDLLTSVGPDDSAETFAETVRAIFWVDEARRQTVVEEAVAIFASQMNLAPDWGLKGEVCFAGLGGAVFPDLDAVFQAGSTDERMFILFVLARVAGRYPVGRPSPPNNQLRRELPASLEAILDRAAADPEPLVRETAKEIGTNGWGGGTFFCPSGGMSGGFY
jgi:hypothetical protein